MRHKISKLRCIGYIFSLTLLCGNPLWADDTEIFFSPVSKAEAQPNIVFLLDASYSMLKYDCSATKSQWTPCNNGTENGDLTRVERMLNAMIEVVNTAEEVNIGVMRFSHTFAGSKVIYPVRDINLELCDGAPCNDQADFTGTKTTVRQELIDVMQEMVMQWRTPTVGALLEASKYFEGKPVVYGRTRWTPEHANNRDEFGEHSRVSHPDSYSGGQAVRSGECSDADLSDPDCADEYISGTPVYDSPIVNECQSNHLLLVTDGESNNDSEAVTLAKELVGNDCPAYGSSGQCAVEIAEYMASNDMRPDIDGQQTVLTHTVGFNLRNNNWLQDIATATRTVGDEELPGYYEAESSDELVTAITSIVEGIDTENTTFVAPAATVDRFSRISHRNDLYLSLFNPSESASWSGNLKRYDLRGNPAELYDANDPPLAVVDSSTGQFLSTSKSYWSTAADGHDIAAGGAASKLNYTNRKAVTYAGTGEKNLFHTDNELSIDNTKLVYNKDAEITNLAPTGIATQSSTSHSGAPGRAIDGNTNGVWRKGSTTHTKPEHQPWWQVALPHTSNIKEITLYNRQDNCCTHRLSDVYVFVSETPFGNATLDELKENSDIWHKFLPGEQSPSVSMNLDAIGRYIRVQLKGDSNPLSLAEVQINGGDSAAERQEKENILQWALGKDVKDEDGDDATDDNRYHMGDPLHSNPITVTYGGTAENPDSIVYVGTNEGYLHAISTRNGIEKFAFMPKELIENLEGLYKGDFDRNKIYGMDGGLTIWTEDKNLDGFIDKTDGDHAYLYAGMRRGGSSYYSLDVSDITKPAFKWQVKGGTSGFEELGETWSQMVPATIQHGTTTKKVLIFGGGYDNSQDGKTTRSPDSVGRALYIVEADSGALVWSGGAGDHNETKKFEDMTYSMPATPKTVDINGDGAVDQIYIGDMGGRVWRFDIDTKSDDLNITGGIIANLGSDNVLADARRFYHTPDISLSQVDDKIEVNIAIGSGYQAHPLNKTIDDRFYLINYPLEFKGSDKYGIEDLTVETAEDGSVNRISSYRPISESDLYDATENLIGEGEGEDKSVATQQLANADGWLIRMEESGEKILGSSVTLDYNIMFTSYSPGQTENNCAPIIGKGKFWAVSLWDGTPVADFDDSEENDTGLVKADRNKPLPGVGLPPAPKTLIIQTKETDSEESTDEVQIVTFSGANKAMEHDGRTLTERVYWSEYPNF